MRKNSYPGKFVVFEGIDGAGGETQSNLLIDFLKEGKIPVEKLTYPDYSGPIGKIIHRFLHKKYEFSPEIQFLLYFTDFLKNKRKIEKRQKEVKFIISDRYFTSTLAYQGLKGFPLKTALNFAKTFQLPKPDLIIYLKISPETSIKRKFKEKGNLDRHESDKKFLGNLERFYKKLIKRKIFGQWVVVNGERPIEKVFEEIKRVIFSKISI